MNFNAMKENAENDVEEDLVQNGILLVEDNVLVGVVHEKVIKIGVFEEIFRVVELEAANLSDDIVQLKDLLSVDAAGSAP